MKLWGKTYHYKFIPEIYKYNSIENRWKLLQGLMDTDGTVCKKGNISFSSVSKQLSEDVKQLILVIISICFL